jgi:hypothetical protein
MEIVSPKDKNEMSGLPELKPGKNYHNLEGMGDLNKIGGVGGMARFANNGRLNSISHPPSMVTKRMVNLREIY